MQKAFALARKYTKEYAPERTIKLFYNDYNEYFPEKREGIIEILKPIKEAGDVDGVGMQSHIDVGKSLDGNDGYMTVIEEKLQNAANEAMEAIAGIGVVSYTEASKEKMEYAKTAYEKLTDLAKKKSKSITI